MPTDRKLPQMNYVCMNLMMESNVRLIYIHIIYVLKYFELKFLRFFIIMYELLFYILYIYNIYNIYTQKKIFIHVCVYIYGRRVVVGNQIVTTIWKHG